MRLNMNNSLTQYQKSLNRFITELEKSLNTSQDEELIFYFNNVKKQVVEQPDVKPNILNFYAKVFNEEYEFLNLDKINDLESSINILASISSKLKSLEIN